VTVFGLLGGAFFLWRWNYFGYPLPNPYYKKGGGELHWDALYASLLKTARFVRPFTPAFLLALWSRATTRMLLVFAIPLAGFASAFILVSDEMNYGARFQYALLPMTLICWLPLVQGLRHMVAMPTTRIRLAVGVTAAAVTFAAMRYSTSQTCVLFAVSTVCESAPVRSGLYDAGVMLSAYRDKNYVMAVTEAGLLPFYSGWRSIDTWGLNDAWIAHHGGITEEYLDRYKPEVVMFHAYWPPGDAPRRTPANDADGSWHRMTVVLHNYVTSRGYVLAGAFGRTPAHPHYYYVRPDFVDSARIVQQIASLDYGRIDGMAPNLVGAQRVNP